MARDEKTGDRVAVSAKAIEELPGVGPATAEKLREAGFSDLMTLAVASPQMVADAAEIGSNVAQKIIIAARDQANSRSRPRQRRPAEGRRIFQQECPCVHDKSGSD